MKTESIPAIVTLTAGFITCIIGILTHMETVRFTKILFLVLLIFFVIGSAVKVVIDCNFKEPEEEAAEEEDAADHGGSEEEQEQGQKNEESQE